MLAIYFDSAVNFVTIIILEYLFSNVHSKEVDRYRWISRVYFIFFFFTKKIFIFI